MRSRLLLTIVLSLSLQAAAFASGKSVPQNQDYWLGIYSGKQKIGNTHVVTSRDKLEGKEVYRRDEFATFGPASPESKDRATAINTLFVGEDLFPIQVKTVLKANLEGEPDTVTAEAVYGADAVERKFGPGVSVVWPDGSKASSKSTPYGETERERLGNGCKYLFGLSEFVPGSKLSCKYPRLSFSLSFLPSQSDLSYSANLSVSECDSVFQVIRREKLTIGDGTYDALLVLETAGSHNILRWMQENGAILKSQFCGEKITFVRESEQKALDWNSQCPE